MFFGGRETCTVELYGKLPLAKDYLRVGCGAGAGQKLRAWLDASFSTSAGGVAVELAFPFAFATGDAWGAPLVGRLAPSSDAGGLRRFPIAIFVERKRKRHAEDLERGLDRGEAIQAELARLLDERARAADGRTFLEAMRGVEIAPDSLAAPEREPFAAEDFLRALWGERGERGLAEACAEIERFARDPRARILRLPLASDLPALAQAHAWWRLAADRGWCAKGDLPSIHFPGRALAASEIGFALLARAPLEPADVAWLAPVTSAAPRPEGDLCGRAPALAGARTPCAEGAPPLAASLHGILSRARPT